VRAGRIDCARHAITARVSRAACSAAVDPRGRRAPAKGPGRADFICATIPYPAPGPALDCATIPYPALPVFSLPGAPYPCPYAWTAL
jgi:hypothetical protein